MLHKSIITEAGRTLVIDKQRFLKMLFKLKASETLVSLRSGIFRLKSQLNTALLPGGSDGNSIELNENLLFDDLKQIEESLTLKRAKYYIGRLEKSITEIRTSDINDINLNRWKE